MIKTIKRWVKSIRWLLNRPPIGNVESEKPLVCDYCGGRAILDYDGVVVFCPICFKKALDKALKGKK